MRIALIHGYLGGPAELAPLARGLEAVLGPGVVQEVALPAGSGFDEPAFLEAVAAAAGADLVIAHSTGGSLALLALDRIRPRRLVLLATPPRVDLSHLARFEAALAPGAAPSFTDLCALVRTINRAGRLGFPEDLPVLILQGEADALVPAADLRHWRPGPQVRTVLVPGAGHVLPAAPVLAAVVDLLLPPGDLEAAQRDRLRRLEPAVAAYADTIPGGWAALGRSPAARRALDPGTPLPAGLAALAPPPALANVEVTTRCPHACPACARATLPAEREDLTEERLDAILACLPQAARVNLVGLGEPTLHHGLPGLVALAAGQGRSVALVTGGAALTGALARRLAEAGLGAITFSLDAGEADLAGRLRPGVPLARITAALREAAAAFAGRVPLAVFTAVCTDNARRLDPVADLALDLGAQAWMLSDLNFAANRARSLAATGNETDRAALRATVDRALAAGLPVLDVKGLEELGKAHRLREWLLRPADRLWTRNLGHGACLSPWQTAVVACDGTLTACDCQPEARIGNVLETPFQVLWNGPAMRRLRMELLEGAPRAACLACPRL